MDLIFFGPYILFSRSLDTNLSAQQTFYFNITESDLNHGTVSDLNRRAESAQNLNTESVLNPP